jgi:Zn-dependent protease
LFDLTLHTLLLRLALLMPILGVHGFALALAARQLGDKGPARDGRLTLNPVAHLDLLGAIGVLFLGLGWMRLLELDTRALRGGIWGVMGVVLAGMVALVFLALAAVWALPLAAGAGSLGTAQMLGAGLALLARLSLGFALFNALPIVPLAGGYLLQRLAPAAWAWMKPRAVWVGLALLALLASGLPAMVINPIVQQVLTLVSGGAGALARF